MKNQHALRISITCFQEIRLLLRRKRPEQALELAEALLNLPLDEKYPDKARQTLKGLHAYLDRYSDRRELSHWKEVSEMLSISEEARDKVGRLEPIQSTVNMGIKINS